MKTVDKYQFNEDTSFTQDGVPAYLAVHTVLKKKFMVKMITFGSDREQESSNYLTKQCQILKKIVHESVYRCHKLLRSKNNFYAVFDLCEGKSLQQLLKQELLFQNKMSIFKQLIQLILELQSRNIVSLNFSTRNIVVQENNKIVVKNFGMAQEFDKQQREKVVQRERFVLGQHTPPEAREGKVYRNSDLYSLGVLVHALFAAEFKKMETVKQRVAICLDKYGINTSLSIVNLKNIATNLVSRSSRERCELKELLVGRKIPSNLSSQKSEKDLTAKLNRTTTLRQIEYTEKKAMNQCKSISNLTTSQERNRQKIDSFNKLLEIILKQRGVATLLLGLSHAVTLNKEADLNVVIELAFLLVKKATITISQLAKLLSKGFNSQYVIQQKQLQMFQKQDAFQHFHDLLNGEMKSTQQKFQYFLSQTKKMLELSNNEHLLSETKSESVNESYFRKVALQFLLQLNLIATDDYVSQFPNDSIYYICILSLLAEFKSLEEMQDCLFSHEVVEIKHQPFYKQLALLPKLKLVELLQRNTTKLYSETSGSFELSVKTTTTPKMLKTKSFK